MTSFSSVFLCLLLVTTLLVAKVTGDLPLLDNNDYDESYKASNASTWDVVEAIANTTASSDQEYQHYRLWRLYHNSSLTKTATSMKKLNEVLTHQEYVNSRIKMAAWLLFGPEKSRSNLLAFRSPHLLMDDLQCVESTVQSFVKHCGVLYVDAVMHRRWFSNICRYAPNKQEIEMAFFAACVFTRVSGAYDDYYEPRKASNASTWEVLEAIANRTGTTSFHYSTAMSFKDPQLYRLWGNYRNSLRSKTPSTMKTLDHIFAAREYASSRIKMAAVILFGPEKAWSTLHSPQRPGSHFVDDWQCFHYTVKLFLYRCDFLSLNGLLHMTSFANLCNNVDDKAAIRDAFIATCGVEDIKPYAINVKNPTIKVIPAPIRGSSEYCERVTVKGASRVTIRSFANIYRVLVRPSETWGWHDKAHICVHRHASLGLCQCEKDEWRPLENEIWSFVMSPYEEHYVDVKFRSGIYGHVTFSLDELRDGWYFAHLSTGVALLFLASRDSKYFLPANADYIVARFIKLVLCVIGVACIFQSYIDTHLAVVAVFTCLILYYLSSISRDLSRIPKLRRETGQEAGSDRETGTGQETPKARGVRFSCHKKGCTRGKGEKVAKKMKAPDVHGYANDSNPFGYSNFNENRSHKIKMGTRLGRGCILG